MSYRRVMPDAEYPLAHRSRDHVDRRIGAYRTTVNPLDRVIRALSI